MSRVYVVVEGQTEKAVIQEVFAPHLANRGVFLFPQIVGKPGQKGGNCKFDRVLKDISILLKQENNTFVTTLFDYYALPNDWPNRNASRKLNQYQQKAEEIEHGLKEAVMKCCPKINPNRFIPYIQMHEIESLLFADSTIMGDLLNVDGNLFQKILHDFDGRCEAINDSSATTPSKRIMQIVPFYKKGDGVNAHGWRILKKIGLPKIREQCPHFDSWIQKLEKLPDNAR